MEEMCVPAVNRPTFNDFNLMFALTLIIQLQVCRGASFSAHFLSSSVSVLLFMKALRLNQRMSSQAKTRI